jgi:hypothetical protein
MSYKTFWTWFLFYDFFLKYHFDVFNGNLLIQNLYFYLGQF